MERVYTHAAAAAATALALAVSPRASAGGSADAAAAPKRCVALRDELGDVAIESGPVVVGADAAGAPTREQVDVARVEVAPGADRLRVSVFVDRLRDELGGSWRVEFVVAGRRVVAEASRGEAPAVGVPPTMRYRAGLSTQRLLHGVTGSYNAAGKVITIDVPFTVTGRTLTARSVLSGFTARAEVLLRHWQVNDYTGRLAARDLGHGYSRVALGGCRS